MVGAGSLAALGGVAASVGAQGGDVERTTAIMRVPAGGAVGRVNFTAVEGGTLVRGRVRRGSLPAGFHGFHVHAKGVCDRNARNAAGEPAPYDTAGGHFDPTGQSHGQHAGDLPTLYITAGNTGVLELVTDRFTPADLLDADGSAVIIHANRDNQANIPERYRSKGASDPGPDADTLRTGDAGARLSCGAVRAAR
jgi:Cu-Zn family superoxide dismutase